MCVDKEVRIVTAVEGCSDRALPLVKVSRLGALISEVFYISTSVCRVDDMT